MPLLGPIDPLNYLPLSNSGGMQGAAEFGKAAQEAAANAADLQIKQLALRQASENDRRKTAFRAEMAALAANPTAAGYNAAQLQYPEFAQLLTAPLANLDAKQKLELEAQMLPAHNAYMKNRPDVALGHMTQLAKAYENSGQPEKASGIRSLIEKGKTDPAFATSILGGYLTGVMGEKRFDSYIKGLNLPDAQREAKAKADRAVTQAANQDRLDKSLIGQRNATAGAQGAAAGLANARTGEVRALLPGKLEGQQYENYKKATDAEYADELPRSLIRQREAAAARDEDYVENGPRNGKDPELEKQRLQQKGAEAAAREERYKKERELKQARLEFDKTRNAAGTSAAATRDAIRTRVAENKLALEREKFEASKLKLSPQDQKAYDEAGDEFRKSSDTLVTITDIMEGLRKNPPTAGMLGAAGRAGRAFIGKQNAGDILNQRIAQAKSSEVIRLQPRGPLSDKDREAIQKGFPPDDASAGNKIAFLGTVKRAVESERMYNRLLSGWISHNAGQAKPAARDMDIEGVKIRKGDTFEETIANLKRKAGDTRGIPGTVKPLNASEAEELRRLGAM